MLLDSQAPLEFWEDAAYTFVYLRNRYWKKSINTSSYEKWHSTKPNLSDIRLWFSTVVALISHEKKTWHKLLPHGFKGVLIEYGGSGYRVFNPMDRTITTSNHCTMFENQKGSDLLKGVGGYSVYPALEYVLEPTTATATTTEPWKPRASEGAWDIVGQTPEAGDTI
jgi:hypothetical protein